MLRIRITAIVVLLASIPIIALFAQTQSRRAAKRARLPEFNAAQSNRVFFSDVFAKAAGERPANPNVALVQSPTNNTPGGGGDASDSGESYAWSKIISGAVIEDEVKAIKLSTDKNVTTPTDFAGRGYKEVRREFTTLAMLFAIINEYDSDVRWKKDGAAARDVFARTASNAKAGGNINVYNEAKKRKDDLMDLLNGSSLATKAEEQENNWEKIADRTPLMQRLKAAAEENLSAWTSNKEEFSNNIEEVLHEAEIVAAIAEVLTREGMEDGDDEDYAGFTKLMKKHALDVVAAVKLNNHEQARKATGEIAKACSDCHDNWR
jgi:hypothetical protein